MNSTEMLQLWAAMNMENEEGKLSEVLIAEALKMLNASMNKPKVNSKTKITYLRLQSALLDKDQETFNMLFDKIKTPQLENLLEELIKTQQQ